MKMRGSAILIAIFLLAAVGSVAFGIGRLFLSESSLASLYENSTIAYYAAESGVEEGMLRYRYDKNSDLPPTGINRNDLDWNPDYPERAQANEDDNYQPSDFSRHIYGMKVKYLGDYYGFETADVGSVFNALDLLRPDYASHKEYYIKKDEAVKLDATSVSPDPLNADGSSAHGDIDLFVYSDSGCANPFIEAKVTGSAPILGKMERKVSLISTGNTFTGPNISPTTITSGVKTYGNLLTTMRNSAGYPAFSTNKVELSLRTINCGAFIGIKPRISSDKIVQPFTSVKSTGYYGGITRTIEAKIDRQAGTVYDLFDYVIYDRH